MKSVTHGKSISDVEVTNISTYGFWLLIGQREFYLPFTDFPWFRNATIAQITTVELLTARHLYWPALDVDLSVDSVEDPSSFPLVSQRGVSGGHQ
jgi:hypothetical protein